MHLKLLECHRFLDSCERYWKALSTAFWGKNIHFLKYQLLNIQKTKGRIVWREREDELLREAYKYCFINQERTNRASGTK